MVIESRVGSFWARQKNQPTCQQQYVIVVMDKIGQRSLTFFTLFKRSTWNFLMWFKPASTTHAKLFTVVPYQTRMWLLFGSLPSRTIQHHTALFFLQKCLGLDYFKSFREWPGARWQNTGESHECVPKSTRCLRSSFFCYAWTSLSGLCLCLI
jgi:hypothetical protein